jgi:hypothetical protein
MRRALPWLFLLATVGLAMTQARAQEVGAGSTSVVRARSTSHPNWRELSIEQREALAPLAGDWEKLDPSRKRKWLEIAAKYPNMSPEGKQRLHERMPQLARLTPEQRETARDNFKRAYSLPSDQRQALTQRYQELPDDRKRALAAQAHPKKDKPSPPRRPSSAPHDAGAAAPVR